MNEFDNGLGDKWDYDMKAPFDSEVRVERLKRFIKPEDTLIFYGGEPLVMMPRMMEIMDQVDCKFQIQSNGILLNQLPTKYLLKLSKMLISIDGDSDRTDTNRGKMKYKIITKNLEDARLRGFTGEIVARMTIEFSDIYKQIMHINELIKKGLFDSIHWQIDAEFYGNDYNRENFTKFVREYNSDIDKLLNWWVSEIKEGRVPMLYPFVGILHRVVGWDKETRLPCGSGYANYTINTKGDLSACPIMNSVENFYCGSIDSNEEKKEINCGGECNNCDYFKICGGRCLYSNDAQLWPKEGHDQVCETIKYLIDGIKERSSEILELIEKGVISREDFDYEKYFGPEIIP